MKINNLDSLLRGSMPEKFRYRMFVAFIVVFATVQCATSALVSREPDDYVDLISTLPVSDRAKVIEILANADNVMNTSVERINVSENQAKVNSTSVWNLPLWQVLLSVATLLLFAFGVSLYLKR